MSTATELRKKTWTADLLVAWFAITGVAAATLYLATEHYRVALLAMLGIVNVAGIAPAIVLGRRIGTRSRRLGLLPPLVRLGGLVAWLAGVGAIIAVAPEDTSPDHHDEPVMVMPVTPTPQLPPSVIPLAFENGVPSTGVREIPVHPGETVRIKTEAMQLPAYRIVSRRRTCGKVASSRLLAFDCTLIKGLIPRLLFIDPGGAIPLAADQPYEVHNKGAIVVLSMQVAANACSGGPLTVEEKRALDAAIAPCTGATPTDIDSVISTKNQFSIELEVTKQLHPSEPSWTQK